MPMKTAQSLSKTNVLKRRQENNQSHLNKNKKEPIAAKFGEVVQQFW